MSRTYMAYLEDAERQQMIFAKRFDVEAARIDLMMEMCDRRTALQIEEAELKVLSEGGTYEDLEYLYDCIMIEAGEQQKKLSIAERISQLIELILKGITGLFTGEAAINKVPKDEPLNVKGYSNGTGILAKCKNFLSLVKEAIKNGIKGIINFASEHKLATFGLALVGGFIALTNDNNEEKEEKEETVTAGDASEQITASEDVLKEISDIIKEIDDAQKQYDAEIKSIGKEQQKLDKEHTKDDAKLSGKINNQQTVISTNKQAKANANSKAEENAYNNLIKTAEEQLKKLKAAKKTLESDYKDETQELTTQQKQAKTRLKNTVDDCKTKLNNLNNSLKSVGYQIDLKDETSDTYGTIKKWRGKRPVIQGQEDSQNDNQTNTSTSTNQESKNQNTSTNTSENEKPETVRKAIKGIFDALWGFVKSIKQFIETLAGKLTDKAKELIGGIDNRINKKPESDNTNTEGQKDNTAPAK